MASAGGGFDHDGHHWVWQNDAREAGEVINRARNTAAKYLDQLVRLGFLVREKLGCQKFGRNRCWYYRPGPECGSDFPRPSWANQCALLGQ